MAEADTEKGLPRRQPFGNRGFLIGQPGMDIFFPDIHRAAQGPQHVIPVEWRDRCPLVQLRRIPGNSIFRQEIAKNTRVFDRQMLQNENTHGVRTA